MIKDKYDCVMQFMEAIMTLQSEEECKEFFSVICTENEIKRLSRRITIAKMLSDGETYRSILQKVNAANISISRVKGVMEKEESVLARVVKRI